MSLQQRLRKPYHILFFLILIVFLIQLFWKENAGIQSTAEAAEYNSRQSRNYKYNGEYGLWIEEKKGLLNIHWLTAKADSGYLKVFRDNLEIQSFATPLSFVHQVSLSPEWGGHSPLKIEYGSQNDEADRQETMLYPASGMNEQLEFKKVDSVYVLGDIHGEYDNLIQLLTSAGIIDEDLNWIANNTHLVCLGDIFDRGHDVIKTLWFLYGLEKEAEQQGGKVHVVLGNHEIMVFVNDLRYTSKKEQIIAQYYETNYATMFDPRTSWLGKWLASKPGIIKINNALYAHGGIDPYFAGFKLFPFDDSLKTYLKENEFPQLLEEERRTIREDSSLYIRMAQFFFAQNSVFWYRGYVLADTLDRELKYVLKKYKVKTHIVAHTALPQVEKRYKGKLFAVDLEDPATEMLLLAYSKPNKFKAFRCTMEGMVEL